MTTKMVVQSVAKAALKTFLQAFVSVFGPMAFMVLSGYVSTVQAGGEVVLDLSIWWAFLIAGVAGGLAALLSLAMNWAKSGE